MRLIFLKIAITILPVLCLVIYCTDPNTGVIRGMVLEKDSGSPIPGVPVQIEGTDMGAMTSLDGSFIIMHVPAGTYRLRATSIFYDKAVIDSVIVTAGQVTDTILIEMGPMDATDLGRVIGCGAVPGNPLFRICPAQNEGKKSGSDSDADSNLAQ